MDLVVDMCGSGDQVHERSGNPEAALALFDEAIRMSPENALVRYHRAKVLISMKRYAVSLIFQLTQFRAGQWANVATSLTLDFSCVAGMLRCSLDTLRMSSADCYHRSGVAAGLVAGRVKRYLPAGPGVPVDWTEGEGGAAACGCARRVAEEHEQDSEAFGDNA